MGGQHGAEAMNRLPLWVFPLYVAASIFLCLMIFKPGTSK